VQYDTSDIEGESEHQMQGNEKSMIQVRRVDRQGACKDMQSLDMEENETISISNINNMVL
jgi:hypothetical protein